MRAAPSVAREYLGLRIETSVMDAIRRVAAAEERTVSSVVRVALRRYLKTAGARL